VSLLLTFIMPSAAMAAKPEQSPVAVGYISGITDGTVFPAGNSGRFRVMEREISGGLEGAINGHFTLAYRANVDLMTQAGQMHGTLTAGDYVFKVNGEFLPLSWVGEPFGSPCVIAVNGNWNCIEGGKGNGKFTAAATVILTPDGHVYEILSPDTWGDWVVNFVVMTGKFQPK